MHAQRFVSSNNQANGASTAFAVMPQPNRAIPRRTELGVVTHRWLGLRNHGTASWSAGPPVYSAIVGSVLTQLKVLWRAIGANADATRMRKRRLPGDCVQDGDWAFTNPVLSVYSSGGTPQALDWKLFGEEDAIASTDHDDPRPFPRRRWIGHPTLGGFEYPHPPTRTLNYWRSALRSPDVFSTKTLRGTMTVRDLQDWEDVVITEIWKGGNGRLSMHAEFFDSLHLMLVTREPLGRRMTWIPKDLTFDRHTIQPISLNIGGGDYDVQEIHAGKWPESNLESYLDQGVNFSFRLVRRPVLMESLLYAEGY